MSDIDQEQVRAGDVVTLSFRGHEFTGKAWIDDRPAHAGVVRVGAVNVDAFGTDYEFIEARREGTE